MTRSKNDTIFWTVYVCIFHLNIFIFILSEQKFSIEPNNDISEKIEHLFYVNSAKE
jgi:hypothetical protein